MAFELVQEFVQAVIAGDITGDHDAAVCVDAEGAGVQGQVVEIAKGEAIGNVVGSTVSVPFDVGGLDAQGRAGQAAVEGADGAFAAVGAEDGGAELGVAFAGSFGGGCGGRGRIKANGLADGWMEGRGPILVEDDGGEFGAEIGVLGEFLPEGFPYRAYRVVFEEGGLGWGGAGFLEGELVGVVDGPEAIALEVPEGKFGVVGFPCGAEFLEEFF